MPRTTRPRPRRTARAVALAAAAATGLTLQVPAGTAVGAAATGTAAPTGAVGQSDPTAERSGPRKVATATGRGGAVSTVDPEATRAGLRVLKAGGNAVDAAVAAAAALGVTEPYSAGIGGGGFLMYYDADSGRVRTIDGRETAPLRMPRDAFLDPATGKPWNFTPELVTSGVSVGVPGTLATWDEALRRWGTLSLDGALAPAAKLARRGFRVDETFRQQTLDNAERFAAIRHSRRLWLRGGDAPQVGSTFRNPALARTYELIGREGTRAFYRGPLARAMVEAVREPAKTSDTDLPVPPGYLRRRDLRRYEVEVQRPTRSEYRDHTVYGMAPSSSGGSTVGEALNILERYDLSDMPVTAALHHYLEASALAFADRGKYLGDRAFVDVPLRDLLSDRWAAERACGIDPTQAMPKPVAAGDVSAYDGVCGPATGQAGAADDHEGLSTTNLTVVDRWGNVVEYTLTIEQTGGSGITVPQRGFLLNNELTDFSLTYDAADPNRIQPGKRPRSSMSPTIVLKDDKPFLALGSPGGSTIITTVLQVLVNRIDLGMDLDEAVAAPRATQRNGATTLAEPEFIAAYGPALTALKHQLAPSGDQFTSQAEIGAATAIEIRGRRLIAVAEPRRRGGGAAAVVKRDR